MRPISRRAALLAAAGVSLRGTISEACSAATSFDLETVSVELPALHPAHHGLRIAQLTDLHIGGFTPMARLRNAIAMLEAEQPDLIVLTGDFLTVKADHVEPITEVLQALPTSVPRVAVLGNHDHWTHPREIQRELERLGIVVLRNENTAISFNGEPLRIVGVDDGASHHSDIPTSFKGVTSSDSTIVLTHTPSTASKLPSLGSLCLAGHTHGGHFVVPGMTEALLGVAGEKFVRGWYQVGGNRLYVSRGIGAGAAGHLPRVGAEPEATLFTLRAGSLT